ncbi:glycosyltransferase family 2 protein [Agrococcus jenensis]|uniref:4,4'-diaponeurosporenoate glycosyltransferase n=1 Tax=Agrococcus jenensis TaxID=46353 RepID=A0A3N2AWH0_9MICO|nr:glycosyltransferase family 2 protein [Agrococcus jenensis]ROR67288.1 glycosyl transferase family 2 [Agrococcus jenensis]
MSAQSTTPSRVSVVIPVRDDAVALRGCLARLAAQSVVPLEIIVVDNGSTDDSAAVALAGGARVVEELRPGVGAAAACGYDAARGDVIARCDADSRVPVDWVARIADAFAHDAALDAITGPGRFHDVPAPWAGLASVAYAFGTFVVAGAAIGNVPLWGSNMALRRSAWTAIAHRATRDDADVHDDLDVAMRLGPAARIRFDPRMRVSAEGRIFRSRDDVRRRVSVAMRTFRRNWAEGGSPGRRWARRLSPSRLRRVRG